MLGAAFGIGFIVGPTVGGLLAHPPARAVLGRCDPEPGQCGYGFFILPESLPERPDRRSDGGGQPVGSFLMLRARPLCLRCIGRVSVDADARFAPTTAVSTDTVTCGTNATLGSSSASSARGHDRARRVWSGGWLRRWANAGRWRSGFCLAREAWCLRSRRPASVPARHPAVGALRCVDPALQSLMSSRLVLPNRVSCRAPTAA